MSKTKETKELKETQNNQPVEVKENKNTGEKIIKTMISGEEIFEGIEQEIDTVKKKNLFTLKQRLGQIISDIEQSDAKNTVFTSIAGFGPYFSTDNCGGFDKGYAYLYIGDFASRSMRNLRTYFLRCLAMNGNKIYVQDTGCLYKEDSESLMYKESDELWGSIFLAHKSDELKKVSEKLNGYDISWFKTYSTEDLLGNCVPCMQTPDIFLITLSYGEFIAKPDLPQKIAKERNCIVIAFIDKKDSRKSEFEPVEEDLVKDLLVHLPESNCFNLETVAHDINFVWDTHASEMHADGKTTVEFELAFVLTLSKVHAYLQSSKEYHYHDNYMEWHVRDIDDDF